MKKLTAFAIKAAMTRPGTYQDGDGLFLKVNKKGGAYWPLRLQRDGKRQDIGLAAPSCFPSRRLGRKPMNFARPSRSIVAMNLPRSEEDTYELQSRMRLTDADL